MATFDLEEQEQLSELKLFWQQNGKFILSGIAGVVVAMAGWQGWNWHLESRAREANVSYATLLDASVIRDVAKVKAIATQLAEQHPGSAQAALGALIGAKTAMDNNDPATARMLLQSAVESSRDAGLRDIATLRLAGLFLDEEKYDDALKVLSREVSPEFLPRMLDLKGDVLAASGKTNEARTAWQDALVKIDALQKDEVGSKKSHSGLRDMLVAKLDALGGGK